MLLTHSVKFPYASHVVWVSIPLVASNCMIALNVSSRQVRTS
jgi:hypothetical protein